MQRRLFVIFILLSLLPAATILLINWQTSQRHLGFLESPGLAETLESSLNLARGELNRSLEQIDAHMDQVVNSWGGEGQPLPATINGGILVFVVDGSIIQITGEADKTVRQSLLDLAAAPRREPLRLGGEQRGCLAVVRDVGPGQLVLTQPMTPGLARNLDAISQGSARIRQTRLYYGDLLRGDTLATLLALGLVLLVASLLLSRYLARRIAHPLRALAEGTRKVAEGNLEHKVDVEAPEEMGQLVRAFNRMTADLRTSKEDLIQAERVAAWRGVARRLAHEIKNPLTPIALAMHRIGKRVDDPTVTDAVQTVLEETENLKRLADEFSQYARLPAPEPLNFDLADLLHSVLELYAEDPRLLVVWESEPGPAPVRVDPGQIRQTLANLVKNAVAAVGNSGKLILNLQKDEKHVILEISDTGPGLPDPPDRVFEPYFTTKPTGTGLGLPIARKIVEDHRGSLTAGNRPEGGARFRLTLPTTSSAEENV